MIQNINNIKNFNNMKRFLVVLTVFTISIAAVAQERTISLNSGWNYDAKIYDDTLFVACDKGLYAYPLKAESATWKAYAFENRTVYNFVKSGAHLMATTNETEVANRKQSLLKSDDYGRTFSDVTPTDAAVQAEYDDYDANIIQLYQHPNDRNRIYLGYPKRVDNNDVSVFHHSKMMESADFGFHWEEKDNVPPCNGKLTFSDNDAAHMLVCGLTPNVDCICPYILETKDDFQNLTNVSYDIVDEYSQTVFHHSSSMSAPSDIIFHQIVFCPGNSQILLAATTAGIAKSDDGGQTWMHTLAEKSPGHYYKYIGVGKLLIDPSNPQIVYAVRNGEDGGQYSFSMYVSKDGGSSWQKAQSYPVSSYSSWIRELLSYNDQLILIAHENDVVCINNDKVSTSLITPRVESQTCNGTIYDLKGIAAGNANGKKVYIQNGKKYVGK